MTESRRQAAQVLTWIGLFLAAFAAGGGLGYGLAVQYLSRAGAEDSEGHDHADEAEPEDHEEPHVAISPQAFAALQMELGPLPRRDFVRTITIPGVVQELPGRSNLGISAPATGVVEQVLVTTGQAVQASESLFRIRLTDEKLAAAQSSLLETVAKLRTVDAEIERIRPLVASGGAIGRRLIDLEYEQRQLATTKTSRRQELTLLGLSDAEIEGVLDREELVTHLVVQVDRWADVAVAPQGADEELAARMRPAAYVAPATSASDNLDFTIESLHVSPGETVQRGADLCHLAYHRRLYIQGQAFESDLPALERLQREGEFVSARFGHAHGGDHHYDEVRERLRVLYLDNHVDSVTQTFLFYVPLDNEPAHDEVRGDGAVFRSWRFKPGQRTHLLVPEETWKNRLVVPRQAVVIDGLETVMFRVKEEPRADAHDHAHEGHDSHGGHSHGSQGESDAHAGRAQEAHGYEFEPVPVQLLYRDERYAVIADADDLHADDEFALNNAQQLLLALKLHTGEGAGGHDHAH